MKSLLLTKLGIYYVPGKVLGAAGNVCPDPICVGEITDFRGMLATALSPEIKDKASGIILAGILSRMGVRSENTEWRVYALK